MQINDLPQGTPTPSDVVPFNTNGLDYKATMEDITELVEVSEKPVTFTSDDEETPTAYKTMATLASGALNALMGTLSKAVSNVRYLYSKLTELNTQVNTNTDDIDTLNSNLGRLTSRAGSALTQQQNLTTSPAIVTCNGSPYNTGSVFTLVSSDGGFRCSRQGMVRVTGYIHVTGVTPGDEIGLSAGVYSGGWVYQSYSMRSKTVTVSIDIFVPVSENQIVYIRASNNSGARGAIDSAQLAVEWLSA